ncbi:hypothetical protein [Acetobacter senegalensis]|nr:hypothetical protein [Acetobacter senegalensis]
MVTTQAGTRRCRRGCKQGAGWLFVAFGRLLPLVLPMGGGVSLGCLLMA